MADPNPPNSVPVFLDSTLDTHFAMLVPSTETIATLKRKIEMEHIAAFPDFGEVVVRGIKVRRREHMYNLSDSMDVSSALNGVESGGRFFHVEVIPAKERTKIVKFGVMSENEKPVQKNRKEYSSKKKEATTLLHPPQRGPSGVRLNHVDLKESLPIENLCSDQTAGKANEDNRFHIKTSTDLTAGRVKTGQSVKPNNKRKTREESKNAKEVSQEKNKVTDRSEKKRSRKTKGSSFVMIGVALPVRENETESSEETLHKSDAVLEKGMDTSSKENPGDATLDASNQVNQTEGLPIEKLGSALPEFDGDKHNMETIGSINQPNRATEEPADPTVIPPIIVETKKERSRKGSSNSNKKDVSQETGDTGIVTSPKKKKHGKTKVSSSEIPSVGLLIRENESRIKDDRENEGDLALQKEGFEKQTEGNSGIPENLDCTNQTECLPVQTLGFESRSQPTTDLPVESTEKSRKMSDNKCKKTKPASFEMLGEDPPVREMEPPVREDIGELGSNLDLQNGIPENPGDPNPTIVAPNPKNRTDNLLIENLDSTPLELNKETKQTESSSNMETKNQPNTNTLAIEQEKPTVEATTFVQSENEKSRKGGGKKTVMSQETTDKLNGDRVVSTNEKKKRKKTKIPSPEVPSETPTLREDEAQIKVNTTQLENKQTQVEVTVPKNQVSDGKTKKRRKQDSIKETQAGKLENNNKEGNNEQSEAGPTISSLRKEKQKENDGGSVNTQEIPAKSSRCLSNNAGVNESVVFHDLSTDKINFIDYFHQKNTGGSADVANPQKDKKKSRTKPKPVTRYKVAVRKIPSKRMGNVMNAPKRDSDAKFNNSTIEECSRGEIGSLHTKPVAGVENFMLPGSDEKGKDSSGDGVILSHL